MVVVNAVWIDGPLPLLQRICLFSWVRHGFEVHLWCYEPLDVPAGVVSRDARMVLPGPILRYQDERHRGSPVLHANLFRYTMLAKYGGAFVDADTLCLRPFGWTVPMVSSEGKQDHPNFAFVALERGCPAAEECYREAWRRLETHEHAFGNFGPALLKRYVDPEWVVPSNRFCPFGYDNASVIFEPDPPELPALTVAVHLWQQIFTQHGRDLTADYPSTSLWEGWKREYA